MNFRVAVQNTEFQSVFDAGICRDLHQLSLRQCLLRHRQPLVLGENWELPDLSGAPVAAGKVELAPMTCTFLVV